MFFISCRGKVRAHKKQWGKRGKTNHQCVLAQRLAEWSNTIDRNQGMVYSLTFLGILTHCINARSSGITPLSLQTVSSYCLLSLHLPLTSSVQPSSLWLSGKGCSHHLHVFALLFPSCFLINWLQDSAHVFQTYSTFLPSLYLLISSHLE
jgi:hypothetical protein